MDGPGTADGSDIDDDALLLPHRLVETVDQHIHGGTGLCAIHMPHGQGDGLVRIKRRIGTSTKQKDMHSEHDSQECPAKHSCTCRRLCIRHRAVLHIVLPYAHNQFPEKGQKNLSCLFHILFCK